jgi:hypothetical protein
MPEATHVDAFAHETEVSDRTEGWASEIQWIPSWVPTMAGDELTTPTATQVLESTHETLPSELSPEGAVWRLQVNPSVVLTIDDPPTAVQTVVDGHESDKAVNVASCTVQIDPPSVDFMIPDPPPA